MMSSLKTLSFSANHMSFDVHGIQQLAVCRCLKFRGLSREATLAGSGSGYTISLSNLEGSILYHRARVVWCGPVLCALLLKYAGWLHSHGD